MEEKRKLFEMSDEVRRLIASLRHAEEGEVFEYDLLNSISLCDVREKYWVIRSAIEILAKDYGLEFECIKNVGYTRISDSEKIKKINNYNRRAYSSAKRGVRVCRNTNFEKLSNSEKWDFNKQSVVSYFISGFSMVENQNLLAKTIKIDPLKLTEKDVDTPTAIIKQFGKESAV